MAPLGTLHGPRRRSFAKSSRCRSFGEPSARWGFLKDLRAGLERSPDESPTSQVVFAIIDPIGTGNLKPFREEIAQIAERHTLSRSPLGEDSESHTLSEMRPADAFREAAEGAEAGTELADEAAAVGIPGERSDLSVSDKRAA